MPNDTPGRPDREIESEREIRRVLDDPASRGEKFVESVLDLGTRLNIEPFCACLRLLVCLDRVEPEARAILTAVDQHRWWLEDRLGRDPGIGVAAADYLHSVHGALGDPVFRDAGEIDSESAGPAPFTELPAIAAVVDGEILRGEESGRQTALALFDSDGSLPQGGDAVAAEALRGACRDTDSPGRLSTGRFGVVLPCAGEREALGAGERLVSVLDASTDRRWRCGVSLHPDHAADAEGLIGSASAALDSRHPATGGRTTLYHVERRARPRRQVGDRLRAILRGDGSETWARVEDISVDGARIRHAGKMTPGSECVLALREPSVRPREVTIRGRVLRIKRVDEVDAGQWSMAIRFTGDPSDRFRLAGLVADLPLVSEAAGEERP